MPYVVFLSMIVKYSLSQASEREKLIVGRIVVVSLVAFGIVWLPLIDSKLIRFWKKIFLIVLMIKDFFFIRWQW